MIFATFITEFACITLCFCCTFFACRAWLSTVLCDEFCLHHCPSFSDSNLCICSEYMILVKILSKVMIGQWWFISINLILV